MNPLPEKITIGDKYRPAMEIIDQSAADEYFEVCVAHCMSFGKNREEAEKIERINLGYFAGYYDRDTQARVEKLFRCAHPIFGAIAENGRPSPERIVSMGIEAGRALHGER